MAYLKDPKTGKYIVTETVPTATVKTSVPTSAGNVKYGKNAQGGYTKIETDTSAGTSAKPNITTVAGLKDYALKNNVDVSDSQPQESTLQKILNVLNTGAYAVGGLISGKGIVKGIQEHTLPSEALGIKNKIGGFVADVLLDPTTYITFGYGSGAKLATKAGEVVLSKTGTSLLKKSIIELGEEGARKALAEKVLQEGGEKLLAKGGLKFAGTEILPRKVVTAPFKMADTLVEKTPVVGKLYQGVKDLAGKAFVPFKSIKDMPGGIGQQYVDKFSAFSKATRSEVGKAVEEVSALGKTAKKELGDKAGIEVGKILENVPKPQMQLPRALEPIKDMVKSVDLGDIKGVDRNNIVDMKVFGSSVEGKLKPNDVDVFVKVKDGSMKFKNAGGLPSPIIIKKGKVQYFIMPESQGDELLDAMLYTGRKDQSRLYSGTAVKVPKPYWNGMMKVNDDTAQAGNKVINEITDYIRGQHKTFATKEKERGLLDYTLPDYLRHYLTPEGRDFLQKGSANITGELNKPLRVKTPFAKERELNDTIGGINKYFQKQHGVSQMFESDAFKAFAARKAEHIKAVNTYDFLTNVGKEFGRPAEVMTKEIKNPVTGKMVTKEITKPIYENGIKYIESSVPQLKGTLLPEQIVKHVDDTYKVLTNEEATKKFLGLYDKVLNFWKGSVTGWFPAFHTRNSIGGIFNNWIAGVKSPTRYLQADQIARGTEGAITTQLGTKYTYSQIRDIANKLGVVGQPGYLDVMKEVEKDIGKGPVAKLMDTPKKAMEIVENRLRLPLFVDRLIKGDAPEQAAKAVFQFHFDYAPEALAPFEQNIMKRLLPFYKWTRGNIPLQLEQMVKQPGKYAGIGKAVQGLQSDKEKAKEEFSILPPYMREGLPIRLGEKGGFSQYLYGLGLPVEDVNRLYKGSPQRTLASFIGELSPLLKYPIEAGTGQNLFTGEPIEENNRVYPFMSKVPGLRDWLEVTEKKNKDGSTSYVANAYKLHFLNTALGRFYTTAGKLTDDKTSGAVKFLYGLIGAKAKSVDIEKEKFWRDQEQQDNIEQALQNRGLLKQYQRAYVPK
ncbi:MAG: hypothetical protein BWY53_00441 [Parcubacteria group bacterium ADurb.Bin326]|nr:MAG: hypothetical protein BWY53_00441 [Parcubacteria group bacterium ADurb.Bin326]